MARGVYGRLAGRGRPRRDGLDGPGAEAPGSDARQAETSGLAERGSRGARGPRPSRDGRPVSPDLRLLIFQTIRKWVSRRWFLIVKHWFEFFKNTM